MSGLLAALVAGASVLGLLRPPIRLAAPPASAVGGADAPAVLLRLRLPLVGLAFVGCWTFLGGIPGAVAGLVVAALAWRALGRLESPAVIRRRAELERDLPAAVHLLGAALAAGSATDRALLDVAEAMPGAIGDEFLLTHHRLLLGVDPASVWRGVEGPLRPLGRSMARAHESGASVVGAIEQLAEDLRAASRLRVEALARSVEVRAAAPLGVCFLPAFMVLGVVPMVAGIFSTMHLFQ
ncbi:MAG TPA: type II secretion system F family protein [Marmoricola sp.]|nr:type II secretion system F family protein [Marmoricola sp.]